MALLYQVDLTAQGNQSVGDAGGAVVIDGKTWYAKGDPSQGVQTYTRDLVNGLGLSIKHTGGGASTPIGTNSALVHPHFFLPLSQVPGWTSDLALLVRARFAKPDRPQDGAALIGLCSSTDDADGITASDRAYDRLAGASPASGTTASVRYKNSSGGALDVTGNAGTISNDECVPGVYMLNARFSAAGSQHLASGMPTTIDSWLATQTAPLANVGATPAPNPGVFFGVDCGGTGFWSYYLQALRIDVIGDILDESAPTVTLISPAEHTRLRRHAAVTVEVTDSNLGFHSLLVVYEDLGIVETAYDSADPTRETGYVVTRSTITDGFRYVIRKRSGWPSRPKIRVRATDGNVS